MDFNTLLPELFKGLANFTWGNALMILVGGILITLAIWKEYEPVLLLPIGFGCILEGFTILFLHEDNIDLLIAMPLQFHVTDLFLAQILPEVFHDTFQVVFHGLIDIHF